MRCKNEQSGKNNQAGGNVQEDEQAAARTVESTARKESNVKNSSRQRRIFKTGKRGVMHGDNVRIDLGFFGGFGAGKQPGN